uniref:Uncharacterized protein LOC102809401 n=1 Tax=Saccoglossus kowalevskii TaxID=10224 RepID=A0ABM0N0J3_SACKO|nr:PREDICTED: uncharacterized protein LOC102809401 [Saccoglossus kowalevskii]
MGSSMPEDAMITVASMPDFLNSLPSCFQVLPDGIYHDPHRVNVFLHSDQHKGTFRSTHGGTILVSNEQELEDWRQNILSKPMFLDVFCKRRVALGVVTIVYEIYFAVLINTRHPHIKQQIERGFNEARRLVSEGKNYSVEFDFTSPIREWYSDASQQINGMCAGSIFGKYGRLCITNTSKFKPCFRCNLETTRYWILCLPCCLLSCPFYSLHRHLTCEDVNITIGAEVALLVPEHLVTPSLAGVEISNDSQYVEHPAAIVVQPPPSYEDCIRTQPRNTSDTQRLIHDDESNAI